MSTVFDDLFEVIPQYSAHHATSDPVWRLWKGALLPEIRANFASDSDESCKFGPFGELSIPYFEMGNINSMDLFGLDEIILFSFYRQNKDRYKRIVDFGANIGLHSIILSKCGFEVRSFEPDPIHVARFKMNTSLNDANVELRQEAVSIANGAAKFVRVKGNTTGSHIAGAKAEPYGELDRFEVTMAAAGPHLEWADLAKIDIEGHEAELISGLPTEIWLETDAVMEIGTEANAKTIFDVLHNTEINIFSQKTGWQIARTPLDMPFSHRDGSVFVSAKDAMPW